MAADVRIGDPIFLADGAAELRVTGLDDGVRTEVVRGGTIRSRAGVAIPAARLSSPALTAKDRTDIPRAIAIGASYVGQSFVRGADDVVELRRLLGTDGPGIVAKIETRPAVESFDAILEVADAVMIARGDLGVEMPYEEVPLIQKQLVRRALDRGVPSIVATQMLESMTAAPRPTRAEASDVANAVFDGADAIMLSGETAIGAYPVRGCRGRRADRLPLRDPGRSLSARRNVTTSRDGRRGARLCRCRADVGASQGSRRSAATRARAAPPGSCRPSGRGVPVIAFSPDPAVVAAAGARPRRRPAAVRRA